MEATCGALDTADAPGLACCLALKEERRGVHSIVRCPPDENGLGKLADDASGVRAVPKWTDRERLQVLGPQHLHVCCLKLVRQACGLVG